MMISSAFEEKKEWWDGSWCIKQEYSRVIFIAGSLSATVTSILATCLIFLPFPPPFVPLLLLLLLDRIY